MKILFINVEEKSSRLEEINDEKIKGVLDLGIHLHLESYRSYAKDVFDPKNVIVLGAGPFSWGGTQRGVFVFRSPIHGGLHSSTIGDFGEYVKRAGYQAVVIEGRSEEPVFLAIKDNEIQFMRMDLPQNIFIKERELYERLSNFYQDLPFRIALVGAGARTTVYGCIVSSKHGRIGIIPDVAGRGGGGSVLYRAHKVVGLAIGGSSKVEINMDPDLIKEQIEVTKKYREEGTFGGNYPKLKDKTIMMNWLSILLPKEERLELFSKLIEGKLIKNYEFSSETCGERCVAACKKFESKVKLDYEPAEGLGPFIGIFDRTYIKDLLHLVDSLGMDAIYLGNVIGSIFEALSKGIISKDKFSLDELPSMDPRNSNSERNFMIARYLVEGIASGEFETLGKNLRKIAREFNILDLCVYVPHGEEFDMTPNFYWSLGLILPVVMHGKYFSDYHSVIEPPESYAKLCAERTVFEYMLDNLGICRFHRGWIEGRIKSYVEDAKYWISKLWEYKSKANAIPTYWETLRTKEIVRQLFKEYGNKEWKDVDEEKIREYWERWRKVYFGELGIE